MKKIILVSYLLSLVSFFALRAEDGDVVDVESYEAETSLFQKIADMEQEKVLMQLEKERVQLQLDLDRMAAEQARLAREQDGAAARLEEQTAEIERQKQAIEQERQKLEEQKRKMAEEASRRAEKDDARAEKTAAEAPAKQTGDVASGYVLREIIGAGTQLVATVESVADGKQKKLSVGKNLDGWTVRAISLDDGLELERGAKTITLGVGAFNLQPDE